MLDEPTIGIDIGSREEIMALVDNFANEGASVLYHTSDYSEMLRMCDRLLFFYNGEVRAQCINDNLTIDQVIEIRDSLKEVS